MHIAKRFSWCIGVLIFALMGCSTVRTQQPLPLQDINAAAGAGLRRVVFYDSTSLLLFPASNRMGVKVNGSGAAAIDSGEFVRVDLPKGEHRIDLSHFDLLYFRDKHTLVVGDEDLFVEIHCTPLGNALKVAAKPESFESRFKTFSERKPPRNT